MQTLSLGFTGFLTGAGLIIAIGAQNAFVLREGLKGSYIVSVVAICAFSDILLILLGVSGLGVVIERWPGALDVLRYAGVAFLTSYGVLAAQRAWRGTSGLAAEQAERVSYLGVILACLAFTFLNPHVYLDTVLLLGSIAAQYPTSQRWVFAAGACAASIVWFSSLGFGARLLNGVFQRPGSWRFLDAAIALLMSALVLNLLFGLQF
ncbi:MAG: LysE/ArgO family amino acid transporter [Pseudomonadota bacterium]